MTDWSEIRHEPARIWSRIGDELTAASRQPEHSWRLGVLGTTSLSGICAVRTVVLRDVSWTTRQLISFADARSPKIAEALQQPQVSWVFYDPQARVQLRVGGRMSVHTTDAVANNHWFALPLIHRRQYLAPVAPGTEFDVPFINRTELASDPDLSLEQSEAGRPHFAVLTTIVEQLDWYYLHPDGHLRLQFHAAETGWQAIWLAS